MSKGKKTAVIIISVILAIVLICVSIYLIFPGIPYYIGVKIYGGKDLDKQIQMLTDAAPLTENIQVIETADYTVNIPKDFTKKETESGMLMYELGEKFIALQDPIHNFETKYEEAIGEDFNALPTELKEYYYSLYADNMFDQNISLYSHTTKDFPLRDADKSVLFLSFIICKAHTLPEDSEFYYYENDNIRAYFIMSEHVNSVQFICKNHIDKEYQIVFRDMTIDDILSVLSTLKFKENGTHTAPLPEGY